MANKKISDLTPISTPLSGSDLIEVSKDQGNASYASFRASGQDLLDFISAGSLTGVNVYNAAADTYATIQSDVGLAWLTFKSSGSTGDIVSFYNDGVETGRFAVFSDVVITAKKNNVGTLKFQTVSGSVTSDRLTIGNNGLVTVKSLLVNGGGTTVSGSTTDQKLNEVINILKTIGFVA